MPSAFSHAIVAIAIGKTVSVKKNIKFWLLGVFCAILPDADVLAFRFGIPYEHLFGHRGFFHSICFAALLALVVSMLFYRSASLKSRRYWLLTLYFFFCTFSHEMLDAMTNGGLGIAFFAPFEDGRYFFPWQVIEVSPLSISAFFSEWGWRVVKSELLWVWLPSLLWIIAVWAVCRSKRKK